MTESKDLKKGDTVRYKVGVETLVIEPIPYGRLTKIMKIVFGAIDRIGTMDNKEIIMKLPEIFEENLGPLISLIFDPRKHSFLNQAWVHDNLTLIHMEEIVERTILVNGLKDFLGRMGTKGPVPLEKNTVASNPMT